MRFKKERGAALLFAFLLLTVIPIFAAAIYQLANLAIETVSFKQNKTKAYYLARAGAEAVIDAWHDYDLGEKPGGSVETLIVDEDYNFIRESEWSDGSGKDKVGEIDLTLTPEEDDSTIITAMARVGNTEHTVNATIGPYVSGLEKGWYNSNGDILPGPNQSDPITVDSWIANLLDIYQAEVKYHDPVYGLVECGRNISELDLPEGNENNKIAYIANSIFFHSQLDLTVSPLEYGALIATGETLVFHQNVIVNKYDIFGPRYGTLILYLPDGLGVELDGYDGSYGKVYFEKPVIREGIFWDYQIVNSGSYYFKKMEEGLDLIAWAEGEYSSDVLIPIPEDDKNYDPPEVRDEIWVFWN